MLFKEGKVKSALRHPIRQRDVGFCVHHGQHTTRLDASRKRAPIQRVLIRTEAGWPGSLNRFPVSVISVPLTFRMEMSWSR